MIIDDVGVGVKRVWSPRANVRFIRSRLLFVECVPEMQYLDSDNALSSGIHTPRA